MNVLKGLKIKRAGNELMLSFTIDDKVIIHRLFLESDQEFNVNFVDGGDVYTISEEAMKKAFI